LTRRSARQGASTGARSARRPPAGRAAGRLTQPAEVESCGGGRRRR
jgi:hypothetical protein